MTLTTRLARLALIAGIGLLGACKPASEAPRATVVNPDASASQPADYRESSPGKPGGTLRLSTSSDTTTLDLHSISHGNTQWLGRTVLARMDGASSAASARVRFRTPPFDAE